MPGWIQNMMSANVIVTLAWLGIMAAIPRGTEDPDEQALEAENLSANL